MEKNLHSLDNCPSEGIAVTEVNEKKAERTRIALEVGNRSIREEREYGVVSGEDTINRTEATKALYKVADEIVNWGLSVYPADIEYTKMKPKQVKSMWEDICVIKGYNISKVAVEPKEIKIYISGKVYFKGEQVTKGDYITKLNELISRKGVNCKFVKSLKSDCDYLICSDNGKVNYTYISQDRIYDCEVFVENLDYDFLEVSKEICIENLFKAHNDMVAHLFKWTEQREKEMLNGVGVTPKEFKELCDAYDRLSKVKGVCSQMEWLALALDYLNKNTDCLMYLIDRIDTVLRYKFSMDLPLERALVRELSRHCKTSDNFKNISIVEPLFRINKDSDRLLHLVPTARHLHEVYEMPFDSGICRLEYMSVLSLDNCLANGDTLEDYKLACYFRGKLPETVALSLLEKLNNNRISKGLTPISLEQTK